MNDGVGIDSDQISLDICNKNIFHPSLKNQFNFDIPSEIKLEIDKKHRQNKYYFGEDEEWIPFDIDDSTILTEQSSDSDNSTWDATASTLDIYKLYKDNMCLIIGDQMFYLRTRHQ